MNKQQFLAMSTITDLKGFVDGRSTHAGRTMYTLHSVPNKCKTVQIASTMDEDEFYVDIEKFKPILHPISELINEIEHKGERFVPIVKLAELRMSSALYIDTDPSAEFEYEIVNRIHGMLAKCTKLDRIVIRISLSEIHVCDFWIIQKLTEWHFNLMDEAEEFVDVNTIDVNPYK